MEGRERTRRSKRGRQGSACAAWIPREGERVRPGTRRAKLPQMGTEDQGGGDPRGTRRRSAPHADPGLRGVFFEREAVAMKPRVQRLARHLEEAGRATLVAVRTFDRGQELPAL